MKSKVYSVISSGLVIGALALAFIASPVKAAAQDIRLATAEIPFSFQVGKTVMPAGSYVFSAMSPNIIKIVDAGRNNQVFLSTLPESKQRGEKDSVVVFTRYGSQYFFKRLDVPTHDNAYKGFPSKQEKEAARAAKSENQSQIAVNTQPAPIR